MKLIEFKEFKRDKILRILNKRKVAITAVVSVILLILLTFILLYIYNKNFRRWADSHILMKIVYEGKLASIEIDKNENTSIYAYGKYISIINGNKLELYNSSGKNVASHDVNVNNPIYSANGKYLVIGDKGKQKVYLISGTKILWDVDVEGGISRVSVNENGFVSVVCTGSTYKSVVCVYNTEGSQLFKTFTPVNTVVDSTISSDNKYLSYAEIDTSKASLESSIKTISMKDAANTSASATIKTYTIPNNAMIINIKYQGSKNLLCMSDSGVFSISDGNVQQITSFVDESKKSAFAGINLSNTIYEINETVDSASKQVSNIVLTNTLTKKKYTYTIDGIAKESSSADDNIAINLGTEVYFINSKGWLIKEYIANQEVKKVIVSDRLAAIVFRDKIEILIL